MTVVPGPTIAGVPVAIIRPPRARRVRLALDPARRMLRLSVPRRASVARALAWAEGQAPWIAQQVARLAPSIAIRDGAVIPYCGEPLPIRHDPGARRGCRLVGDALLVGGPSEHLAAAVLRWLRAQALATLASDTTDFARRADVAVARVAVGAARSRWGSCTTGGTIRYNWRLILAPPWVRRATAAHEVAHRLHMDHSAAFHAAVERIADAPGDAALSHAWLRANGAALHGIGNASASSSI